MNRIIKVACMALAMGAFAVPGFVAAGDEVRVSTSLGDTQAEACAEAKETAAYPGSLMHNETVVDVGKCDCGEESSGLWSCTVIYKVRTTD